MDRNCLVALNRRKIDRRAAKGSQIVKPWKEQQFSPCFYENGEDIEILMRLLMICLFGQICRGCYMRMLLREYDDDARMI